MILHICRGLVFLAFLLMFCPVASWAALARTTYTIQVSGSNHGTGAYTTGSFTPPNSSLLVVAAYQMTESGSGGADKSGDMTLGNSAGLTCTARVNAGDAHTFAVGVRIWTCPVTTGSSMTVNVDSAANNIYKYMVHIYAYTGYNTGTPTGATATGTQAASNGNFSITLSGAPAATSEVVAVLGLNPGNGTIDVTPGTGWTEIYQTIVNWDNGSQSQIRNGSTSTAVAWGAINGAGADTVQAALEIIEGAGGGGGSVLPTLSLMGVGP